MTSSSLESQQERTTRLFESAFKALASEIPYGEPDWPEIRRQEYASWYVGGSSAAEFAVTNCEPLREAWGKGDERRSSLLTLLFTMPIVLRFYRLADRMNLLAYSLTGLLKIQSDLPHSPEQLRHEYLELAKQFEFDEHRIPKPDGMVLRYHLEMAYLFAQSLGVLGRPSVFSLGNVCIPVASLGEFYVQGGVATPVLTDLSTYFAILDAVGNGFTRSMEALRTMRSQVENEVKGRNA